jgi:hypothetical protein
MMMMEGLRWPILAAVLSFSLLLVLLLALLMREHEVQLVEMRLFADFGIWSISTRPQRQPDVAGRQRGADDHRRRADYPDVAQAWTKFMRCMIVALAGSLFFSGPLATWFVRLSQKIGVDILKERHERGAMLVSAAVLAGEIDAHNAAEFAAELAERHPPWQPTVWLAPPSPSASLWGCMCPMPWQGSPIPGGSNRPTPCSSAPQARARRRSFASW